MVKIRCANDAEAHAELIASLYPELETEVIDGGQAHYCLHHFSRIGAREEALP